MKDLMPEMQATERATLIGYLDFERAAILTRTAGLTHEQLGRELPGSGLTLAALVKHLWHVEDTWFTERFFGMPAAEPWSSAPFDAQPRWAYDSAASDDAHWLREQYQAACARNNEAIEVISIDAVAATMRDGQRWTLRWMLGHLVEETARHVGHADLIRGWLVQNPS